MSIIESNLKSNLSVVFILMFCWVSTTAAVTTVLPMKQSKPQNPQTVTVHSFHETLQMCHHNLLNLIITFL